MYAHKRLSDLVVLSIEAEHIERRIDNLINRCDEEKQKSLYLNYFIILASRFFKKVG